MSAHTIDLRPGALHELKDLAGVRTDAQLAARLGISAPLLSQIRTGRRGVGSAFIAGVLAAFGIPVDTAPDSIYTLTRKD